MENPSAEMPKNIYARNWKAISSTTFTSIKRASQFYFDLTVKMLAPNEDSRV